MLADAAEEEEEDDADACNGDSGWAAAKSSPSPSSSSPPPPPARMLLMKLSLDRPAAAPRSRRGGRTDDGEGESLMKVVGLGFLTTLVGVAIELDLRDDSGGRVTETERSSTAGLFDDNVDAMGGF